MPIPTHPAADSVAAFDLGALALAVGVREWTPGVSGVVFAGTGLALWHHDTTRFEDPHELARFAATCSMTLAQFRAESEYLVEDEPPPLILGPNPAAGAS